MNPDLGPPFTRAQAQTRATFMRTYDGRRVVVRNGEWFTDTVAVHTAFEHRRLEYDVGIVYGDDGDGHRARQREGWPAGNTDVPASQKVADAIRRLSASAPRGAKSE